MPAGTNLEANWDQNRCQDHFKCRTTLDDAHTSHFQLLPMSRVDLYGSPGGTFLLITYYLLLITYYLSLITYYLLLITYYLLLITYYLSLITYYLLLIISFITPITAGNSKYAFPVTAVAVVVVVVAVYL